MSNNGYTQNLNIITIMYVPDTGIGGIGYRHFTYIISSTLKIPHKVNVLSPMLQKKSKVQ